MYQNDKKHVMGQMLLFLYTFEDQFDKAYNFMSISDKFQVKLALDMYHWII